MTVADGARRARRAPWGTVLLLGALLAYADGFVVTVVQGAVGAVERQGAPFATWLTDSTLAVPAFGLAVWAALRFSRRRFARWRGRPGGVLLTGLAIAAAGTFVGTALLLLSTAYDYHLQSQTIQFLSGPHVGHGVTPTAQQDTLAADLRGARLGARLMVLANVVLVAWVVAMRGGRLEVGWFRQPTSARLEVGLPPAPTEQDVQVGPGGGQVDVLHPDVGAPPAASDATYTTTVP